ncbi:hypothetical protein CXB51_031721 [Gossypium anomalum]|uniref:Uncharacterized protein n=1 Tax=Gossypium anomalum TaxID=47600 RepID=A0A8J5XR95_9ROSI|nr:hypothetical protein CXB51_031721 [Gossypium anomalum]
MFLQSTALESSLFDHLINIWEFNPRTVPGTFSLYFLVDFKFQSPLYWHFGRALLTTILVAGIDSTIQFTISKMYVYLVC